MVHVRCSIQQHIGEMMDDGAAHFSAGPAVVKQRSHPIHHRCRWEHGRGTARTPDHRQAAFGSRVMRMPDVLQSTGAGASGPARRSVAQTRGVDRHRPFPQAGTLQARARGPPVAGVIRTASRWRRERRPDQGVRVREDIRGRRDVETSARLSTS